MLLGALLKRKFPTLLTTHIFSKLVCSEATPNILESSSYSTPDANVWLVPSHLIENEVVVNAAVFVELLY